MDFKQLVYKSRTFRRFDQSRKVNYNTLSDLVDLGRMSPSGANRQPLKYLIVNEPELCSEVFPCTAWAGYLKEWPGPVEGERPSAYIIIVGDKTITENFGVDHGIAAQSIMLGASSIGLGGCIIASISKDELRKVLALPMKFEILLVLALGIPVENVVVDPITDGDVKYWRDAHQNHHVPKRTLDEIILKLQE
jgi:nitroreductase